MFQNQGRQDYDSVSESETTSTAPSSLQTVLRGPGAYNTYSGGYNSSYSYGISEAETDVSPPSTPTGQLTQEQLSEQQQQVTVQFKLGGCHFKVQGSLTKGSYYRTCKKLRDRVTLGVKLFILKLTCCIFQGAFGCHTPKRWSESPFPCFHTYSL